MLTQRERREFDTHCRSERVIWIVAECVCPECGRVSDAWCIGRLPVDRYGPDAFVFWFYHDEATRLPAICNWRVRAPYWPDHLPGHWVDLSAANGHLALTHIHALNEAAQAPETPPCCNNA